MNRPVSFAVAALGMIGSDAKTAVPDFIELLRDEEMDLGLRAKVIEALIVRQLAVAQGPIHWECRK